MSEQKRAPRPPYPQEFRDRAVRMVLEHQDAYPSQWKAIQSIAEKLKVNHESLRQWVRRAETDAGKRPGLTSDERARLKELERESEQCIPQAGHVTGEQFSCQANMMSDPGVPEAMAQAFAGSEGSLAFRILSALDAAEAAGGDFLWRQSAAVKIVAA